MRIGCCTSSAPSVTDAAIIAGPVIDYIEENVQGFLVPTQSDAIFTAKLETARACGKAIEAACCFLPGSMPCVGPVVDQAALLVYAATAFRRASQAGITRIVFGSGGSRKIPDGWTVAQADGQFIALLSQLAPLARRHGVTIVVEPLNRGECNYINTVREGAAIVRAVADPSVRLLADLFHMARNDESPEDLAAVADLIHHVHVAERETRSQPGIKGDDFRPFLAVLRRAGYDQRISLECSPFPLSTGLAPAVDELKRQWQEAAPTAMRAS